MDNRRPAGLRLRGGFFPQRKPHHFFAAKRPSFIFAAKGRTFYPLQEGCFRPHHLFFKKRDGAAWRYQRKIVGGLIPSAPPEAKKHPRHPHPACGKRPHPARWGSRGTVQPSSVARILNPLALFSWTAPAARSLFAAKREWGAGGSSPWEGKKRGLWPQKKVRPRLRRGILSAWKRCFKRCGFAAEKRMGGWGLFPLGGEKSAAFGRRKRFVPACGAECSALGSAV